MTRKTVWLGLAVGYLGLAALVAAFSLSLIGSPKRATCVTVPSNDRHATCYIIRKE